MTDDQELRQHWQQLAEQLGLEPSTPFNQEVKDSTPQVAHSARIEDREPPIEIRESKIEERPTIPEAQEEPTIELPSEVLGSEPSMKSPVEPTEEYRRDEPVEEERRGGRRGRGGRRPDRGDRSSRPRRGGRSWIREEEPIPAEERAEPVADEEISDIAESSDEADLAILHDSSSPEPEKDEEEDGDDVDTLSDWNVPSWTELIGSLYRPER